MNQSPSNVVFLTPHDVMHARPLVSYLLMAILRDVSGSLWVVLEDDDSSTAADERSDRQMLLQASLRMADDAHALACHVKKPTLDIDVVSRAILSSEELSELLSSWDSVHTIFAGAPEGKAEPTWAIMGRVPTGRRHRVSVPSLEDVTFVESPDGPLPQFDSVVLGGTFDQFHVGHQKLLRIAAFAATRRVVVGVTSDDMARSKPDSFAMSPVADRIASVRRFLRRHAPRLEAHIETIDDPFGPSTRMDDLGAIVLSSETLRGGLAVNRKRAEMGRSQLHMLVTIRKNMTITSSTYLRRARSEASSFETP